MNKRQSIRKAIIIGMFFLFPITITWLSPALPVIYAGFGGIISGAIIIFFLQFLISIFLGRVFCGYVCSAAGLQECMMRVSEKRITNPKINIVKWFIWVLWIITIIIFFILAGGINEVDFFAGTVDNWIFLFAPYRYMIYFGVILLIAGLHLLVGRRAFCHSVCWMAPFMIIGMKVSDWLRLPRFRLKSNKDICIKCNQCTKICPMSLDVMAMVESENMKNSECILCAECIDICPKKSIEYTFTNCH
ncbi:MAG: 4Fe-4S dicluster domain-containing protein [Lachnospiraceae bacterium]|nr:4Fe-4S dicluster domain-containing protein [Lachnospiraceae bacterium]